MQAKESGAPARSGTFIIDNEDCMRCAVLAPDINTKAFDCTYENGNKNCPARDIVVIIGTDSDRAGKAIAKAVLGGDFDKSAKLLKKLSGYHPVVQQDVMRIFKEAMLTQAISDALPHESEQEPQASKTASDPQPEADAKNDGAEPQAEEQSETPEPAEDKASEAAEPKDAVQDAVDKADWDD